MRIARFVLASLALFATSTLADPTGVVPNEPTVPARPTIVPPSYTTPTPMPQGPTSVSTPYPTSTPMPQGPTSVPTPYTTLPPRPQPTGATPTPPGPTRFPPMRPTIHPQPPVPVPVPSKHYCHKYLEHAACRQCVTVKGSLGFTPNADLHWCPTPGTDHYDHLGSCQLISSPCASSFSTSITNITLCPNDPAPSKPSCGACTADAYIWCQSDDQFDDEYMGVCKDASKLFRSRAAAELVLRQREERDDDSNVYDVIDQLCGPTHTAIIDRKECPRKHHHRFGRGIIIAVLFHMIPILLCLSACCLCVRAIKRRRAARRQALLDVTAVPSAPSQSSATSDYPGVVSTTYATDAPLPVPLPNGSYVVPAATAPTANINMSPMPIYPTLATPSSGGLRAPLLNNGSINSDGLIYGHATASGYQRIHQEI